jgi:hypothetical protein
MELVFWMGIDAYLIRGEPGDAMQQGEIRDCETPLAHMHFREAEISDQRCRMTSVWRMKESPAIQSDWKICF